MNLRFYPCRFSPMSKFGLYSAAFFYPIVAVGLLFIAGFLCVDSCTYKDYTLLQTAIILFAMIIALLLAAFLFVISRKCYLLESRRIALDSYGFVLEAKKEKRYHWDEICGVGIIAYAASASKQIYQTQICIFLEPVNDKGLKRLRDSYLYGAFHQQQYVLLDYDESMLNQITNQAHIRIDDFRIQQMKML